MTNYEKAVKLLNKGIAKPHYTYEKGTDIIVINLRDNLCGYAYPKEDTIEIVNRNEVVWHGNISDDLTEITGTRNNHQEKILAW